MFQKLLECITSRVATSTLTAKPHYKQLTQARKKAIELTVKQKLPTFTLDGSKFCLEMIKKYTNISVNYHRGTWYEIIW